MKKNILSRKI